MENNFDTQSYLDMELLRFTTAGSVDDGKSTLIGRLLYDSKSIFEDQVEQIEQTSKKKGLEHVDLSLFTDGLKDEREQGITIDVAYRYFATPKRKFIIADTPGHVQYTRNMVTGASTANLALILVDARNGVIEQTKRHTFIASLLQIPHVFVCINKMDLVDFDQNRFEEIRQDITRWMEAAEAQPATRTFVPISALKGDNVAQPSSNMDWYEGKILLQVLEELPTDSKKEAENILQVQYVIRPKTETHHDYRGFAGKVNSGKFQLGDAVVVQPSGRVSKIKSIEKYGVPVTYVQQGEGATLLLEDEVDASRGNTICGTDNTSTPSKELKANVCWMQNADLVPGSKYWVQLGVQRTQAKIRSVQSRVDLDAIVENDASSLGLNDIGGVELVTAQPLVHTSYKTNRKLGAFILIDAQTNNTAGVGFIK